MATGFSRTSPAHRIAALVTACRLFQGRHRLAAQTPNAACWIHSKPNSTVRGDLACTGHVQELANDAFDEVRVTVLAVVFFYPIAERHGLGFCGVGRLHVGDGAEQPRAVRSRERVQVSVLLLVLASVAAASISSGHAGSRRCAGALVVACITVIEAISCSTARVAAALVLGVTNASSAIVCAANPSQ